jgi:hypothetical protein
MGFHGCVSACWAVSGVFANESRLAVNAPEDEQTNLVGALREKVANTASLDRDLS